jgi:hydrogenase maturation protease
VIDQARVHILCFGNVWQGDDGFGLHVLERLRQRCCLPPHVGTFDAGTAGLNALPLFEGCRRAVLVDAVKTGANIGRLHRLSLNSRAPNPGQQGLHGAGVEHLLAALPAAFGGGTVPELVLIGAEVGQIAPFTTVLSPPVAAAVAPAIRLIALEFRSCQPG